MKESVKSSFVFIGTVIGAGFATGQEVLLYFKESDVLVCIFAGIVLGLFSIAFMLIGQYFKSNTPYLIMMFICSFISFIAMFCGVKSLFLQLFNIDYIDVLIIILASLVVLYGIEKIKLLNLIAVPIIIVLICVLFLLSNKGERTGNLNFQNGIAYVTMNMIVSSGVMMKLGKNMSKKNILVSGAISGVIFAVLLSIILITIRNESATMPLLQVAKNNGILWGAGIVIFLSIFTTMVSSLDMAVGTLESFKMPKIKSLILVILLSLPFKLMFSFENIVNYYYPIMSIIGLILIFGIFGLSIRKKYIEIFDNIL